MSCIVGENVLQYVISRIEETTDAGYHPGGRYGATPEGTY